jgi:hypothetical protein
MKILMCCATAVFTAFVPIALAAEQSGLAVDKDDITIRGCVTRSERYTPVGRMPLVWSRNDILIAMADDRRPMQDGAGRLIYWLDDEDLRERVGQEVEIEGDLKDIKKGEMEVEQHDDYTTIQLKFSGKEERIRVPTPWLSSIGRDDDKREYQVVVQRVDVDDVRVLGPCGR